VTDRRKFSLILEHEPTDAGQAQSIAILEKAEGPVAVSVAFEFLTFLHVSFTVRSQIEARKNLGESA